MKGVSTLQDLKPMLENAGFKVTSGGWYVTTVHGNWGIAHGEVYLNNVPIKTIAEAPIPKQTKKAAKKKTAKKKAAKKKTKK
jgi:hypothetical protein